jgi:tetratricopeptide (TPR) repeat protein
LAKTGRNDPCPCGSGRKFKQCHGGAGPGAAEASAETFLRRGHELTEAGRFDEAAASYERCIALAPGSAAGYFGLVTSRRVTDADRPLIERMEARLAASEMPDPQRMTLHFAAGKALDDLKDYAAAIRHFDAANGIRGRLKRYDPTYFERKVDALSARFTRELFEARKVMGNDDPTPVLVLGLPRSGTTLIERIVSSHPQVAGGGELRYWNDQGLAGADADIDRLARAADGIRTGYLRLLRKIGPKALRVTDKMPFNFLWIGVIHLLLPNARFIHCRRNPIDTCLSIYTTHFQNGWGVASDRAGLANYYRQYLRLMEHWRSVIPPDRLIDVDYEETTSEPEATARRLIAFCGLEWDDACLQPERNADAVRTASKWQARQPIYRTSVERWRRYEPWIGELRGLMPGA